ncbi:hypothetical protein H0H81_011512 [Sphagnurus paluster]|uniref:Uncharacterized protein n=1 Tax=Sphagnurus paluster TaxID=117069 RepID=A0A9P7GJW9_9AGAR|nr:hypothetical protein H0H81_011512 [Sphagnurus paluster]
MNDLGIPIFPPVDVGATAPTQLASIINDYLASLWDFVWPMDSDMPALPWADITTSPDIYFDTVQFMLPTPLKLTDLYDNPGDLYPLAQWFLKASATAIPFQFRTKDKITLRISQRRRELNSEWCSGQQDSIDRMSSPELALGGHDDDNEPQLSSPERGPIPDLSKLRPFSPLEALSPLMNASDATPPPCDYRIREADSAVRAAASGTSSGPVPEKAKEHNTAQAITKAGQGKAEKKSTKAKRPEIVSVALAPPASASSSVGFRRSGRDCKRKALEEKKTAAPSSKRIKPSWSYEPISSD